MADTELVLGSVTFQDFEIPAQINFGGEQSLSIKKLIGGVRVIDPLGQDDDDIEWSGRFQSPDATDRALALDEMRKGGQPQTLTYGGFSYSVVVRKFRGDYQRFYQIPYSITLTVVQDNTASPQPSNATLDDVVGADMDSADGIASDLTDTTVPPALGGLQSAIDALGTLQGATLTALAPVAAAAAAASGVIQTAIDVIDPTILSDTGAVAGIVAGGAPAAMIAVFQGQAAAIAEEARLQELIALTSRIQTNLGQATG